MKNHGAQGNVRKVNYPETWDDAKVISMYKSLKSFVDESLKKKKQGVRKKIHTPRDMEGLVKEIFSKKRGITFRSDTGSCEVAQNSKHVLDPDWGVKGWFDAAKIALEILKSDYKRASSATAPAEGDAGARAAPDNRRPVREDSSSRLGTGQNQHQPLRDGFGVSQNAKENFASRKRPLEPQQQCTAPIGTGHPSAPGPQQQGRLQQHHHSHANVSAGNPVGDERLTLARMPSASVGGGGGAGMIRSHQRDPLFDPASAGPAQERVPIHFLTSNGAARMVEEILRRRQPAQVHWDAHYLAAQQVVSKGLTGEDIAECSVSDLAYVIKGPSSKRAALVTAIEEFRGMGGLPRLLLHEMSQAPPGQPLQALSSMDSAHHTAQNGGSGGWSVPWQPKRERL